MLKKNLDFRNLFFGRLFLNLGDSLVYILFMWFLYSYTKDSLYTGIAGFFFTLPSFIGIFWGPIVDKSDNKRLLTTLSKILIVSMIMLSGITSFLGVHLYVLIFFVPILAFASELSYPVGESLMPKIVNESDLTKANSLIMVSTTTADLFFNAASAVIISFFTFNKLLFFVTLIFISSFLFLNKIKYKKELVKEKNEKKDSIKSYLNDLKEGIKFVKKPVVLLLLCPLILFNFVYAIFYVGLPEFSSVHFNSPSVYGIILMLFGIGSMIGATASDYLSNRLRIGYLVSYCYLIAGLSWILAIYMISQNLVIFSICFTVLSGMSNGVVNIAYSVLFQKLPDRDIVGRVHTINMTLLNSTTPIASLLGGIFVRNFGSVYTIVCCGLILSLVSLIVLLNRKFRNLPHVGNISNIDNINQ